MTLSRNDTNDTNETPNTDVESAEPDVAIRDSRPYSVFTTREKWFIICIISFAATFSPLTANIYFPAIPALVKAFSKSTELINLTVTMYLVMQGLAPMLWGPVSDRHGRRPIFLGCLLILALSCVGLALVPVSAYWLLMLLRCLQAAGSASTIAIGAGVIGDITLPRERGGFLGIFTLGPMLGPAIGPVIGGALAEHLGWRSIFWFMCIAASGCFIMLVLFLPETLRRLVGDGSVIPSALYRPVIPIIKHRGEPDLDSIPRTRVSYNPFRLLVHTDIIILLGLNAIVCAVYNSFTATTSTLFTSAYPFLSETKIGLCFLAIGGGMAIGSTLNGKFLDWEYRRIREQLKQEVAITSEGEKSTQPQNTSSIEDFPIEKARLRALPFFVIALIVCCAGYGWCLQKQVNLAVPLVLQTIVGYISIAVMNSTQTLMIDLFPRQGSSITACNNLVRCSFSALLISVIQLIINAIGIGWTFVLLGGITVLVLPLLYLEMRQHSKGLFT
ncbi:Quinidine resistance protein 1 [Hypsizygus marmoreus]|uniref:Quinidine resistance protein 1 n=1 Tax=Hypsizygus marmoreus TaxID=39966 RepID=A0A369KCP1_HYPMA|nr:Quinidine resistance protein 1 [Hypsizygus marmoreus]